MSRLIYDTEDSDKQLLLITYFFPPFPGVGGFRWSQLCKFISRKDYKIHVLTVDWKRTQADTLLDEVTDPNIVIHRIKSGYFHNLQRHDFKSKIMRGIRNKIFIHIINNFFYPIDEAQRWGKHLIPYAKQLIDKYNLRTVIATGSPFSANYIAAKLKEDIPDISLIQDLRDPWANSYYSKYFHNETLKAKALKQEHFSLRKADAVVCVTEGVKNIFEQHVPTANYYVVRNGFDPSKIPSHSKIHSKPFKIIHAGNIVSGRGECCAAYLEAIQNIDESYLQTIFVGSVPKEIISKFQSIFRSNKIILLGTLEHQEAINHLSMADAALHFNARHSPDAASTKLYEYAATKKPILSINFGFEPDYLIKKYNWGHSINLNDGISKETIINFFNHINSFNFDVRDIYNFSYKNLADDYIKIIENHKP